MKAQKKIVNARWKTELIRVGDIDVASYQRELNERRSKEIAEDWNPLLFNPPKVSRRGGKLWAVDGQHTIAAARLKFGEDYKLECRVCSQLTYEQEALTFAGQRKHGRALGAMNTFKAEREGKDPRALKIDRIVKSIGLEVDVGNSGGQGRIRAIKAMRDAEERHGNLKDTLELLALWMDGNSAVYSPKIINSVSLLLHVYGDDVDQDRLLKVLCKTSPRDLLLDMKEARAEGGNRRSVALVGAQLLKERYNKLSRVKKLIPWAKAISAATS